MADYRVSYSRAARKEIDIVSAKLALQLVDAISDLGQNPRPAGCKKLAGAADVWRIRVRDFRVIDEVNDRARKVLVTRVRHRREVCRD